MTTVAIFRFLLLFSIVSLPQCPAVYAVRNHSAEGNEAMSGEPQWLHDRLKNLPGNGEALHQIWHKYEETLEQHPEIQKEIVPIAMNIIRKKDVIDAEKSGNPIPGVEQIKQALDQKIQTGIESLAKQAPSLPIFTEFVSPPMYPIYRAIEFHPNPSTAKALAPTPQSYAYSAQMNAQSGNPKDAIADANKALEMDPNNVQALEAKSAAEYKLGDYSRAQGDASRALELNPGSAVGAAISAAVEGRDHPADLGIAAAPAGTKTGWPQPGGGTGEISGAGEAIEQSMRGLSVAEAQSNQQTKDARTSLTIHDYNAAIAAATKAIELNSKNAQAYVYRSIALSKAGRLDEALRDADAALKIAPNNSVALSTKAYVLNRLRKYGEAKSAAERAISLNVNDADAWYQLAYAEAGLGNKDAMMAALQKAAEISPERFQNSYQAAVQLPEAGDLTFLFSEGKPALPLAAAYAAQTRIQGRFIMIALACLIGGFLVALGLLHLAIPDWAKRLTNFRRRKTGDDGRSNGVGSRDGTDGTRQPSLIAGNYEILQQIGSGGMGRVYQALDRSLERHVAVKIMREEIRDDPKERDRFLREARLVAALHHPNIVEIHSIIEDGSEVYMIFELIDGESLEEVIQKRGRLSYGEAKALFRGVCDALDYAHGKGIVHRDLKPSNIMVNYQDQIVKVMDFGVARQAREALSKLAATNTIVGTPPYMAPEAEQGLVRRESDVYALAVCLYQMLTGELPFVGTGAGMLMNKMNMKFEPPSKWIQGLHPGLNDLFSRALQPDPEKRMKSAGEFYAMLESFTSVRK